MLDQLAATDVRNKFLAVHGVCSALQYLHARHPSVVHGDVKAKNIMCEIHNDQVRCKLLDFGLARVLSGRPRPLGGTLCWMAPEVYRHNSRKPECSSDVYSLGRLIFFVLTGTKPLAGYTERQVKHMLLTSVLPSPLWPGNNSLENRGRILVDDCVSVDAVLRPSMSRVYDFLIGMLKENEELAGLADFVAPDQLRSWTDEALNECLAAPLPGHPSRVKQTGLKTATRRQEEQTGSKTATRRQEEQQEPIPTKPCFALQGMAPTQRQGILFSLLMTLMQWNFELPSEPCCLYHAALTACMRACETLQARQCQIGFMPGGSVQCNQCGLLLEDGESCTVCCGANLDDSTE